MTGNLINLSKHGKYVDRECECTWCETVETQRLPVTMKPEQVECTGCLQKKYIKFQK